MYRVLIFFTLLLTWLVMSGIFDAFHIGLGVISCGLVTWWSSDFMFPDRSMSSHHRLTQALRIPGYIAWLLWRIVVANWHVLKLALSPRLKENLDPQMVKFRTGLESEFEKYVFAQSITLTPGTVTVRIEGDEFLVHAISKESAEGLMGPMAERVRYTFGDHGR